MRRKEQVTLLDHVYGDLKRRVLDGDLFPGQALTVRDVAATYGTSRMPAREALHRLAAEQALEMLPNGQLRVRLLDAGQRRQLLELRAALEPLAIRHACRWMTDIEIERAALVNQEMTYAIERFDITGMSAMNREFHFSVYRATRIDLLFAMIEMIWLQIGPALNRFRGEDYMLADPDRKEGWKTQLSKSATLHERMLDALRQRDEAKAVEYLIEDISESALIFYTRSDGGFADGDEAAADVLNARTEALSS